MGFNLKSIKTVQTFDYEVKDEQGNPTGVIFTLAGPNHPIRKAAQMAANRKLIASARKTGRVELPDPEDSEAQRVKDLTAFTLGWRGYADESGEVAFTPEAASALYGDPELLWLSNQIDTALGEQDRFTKRVGTS
ncbi:MAG: hypothetical protein IPN21_18870 [Burkholderiales bacterium]|nr:hypothetical protein [Burkholderiales bacterium]MBK8667889.1 hypothetical protein [Burkholderiales bacterium]